MSAETTAVIADLIRERAEAQAAHLTVSFNLHSALLERDRALIEIKLLKLCTSNHVLQQLDEARAELAKVHEALDACRGARARADVDAANFQQERNKVLAELEEARAMRAAEQDDAAERINYWHNEWRGLRIERNYLRAAIERHNARCDAEANSGWHVPIWVRIPLPPITTCKHNRSVDWRSDRNGYTCTDCGAAIYETTSDWVRRTSKGRS